MRFPLAFGLRRTVNVIYGATENIATGLKECICSALSESSAIHVKSYARQKQLLT